MKTIRAQATLCAHACTPCESSVNLPLCGYVTRVLLIHQSAGRVHLPGRNHKILNEGDQPTKIAGVMCRGNRWGQGHANACTPQCRWQIWSSWQQMCVVDGCHVLPKGWPEAENALSHAMRNLAEHGQVCLPSRFDMQAPVPMQARKHDHRRHPAGCDTDRCPLWGVV